MKAEPEIAQEILNVNEEIEGIKPSLSDPIKHEVSEFHFNILKENMTSLEAKRDALVWVLNN